jgi:integrase
MPSDRFNFTKASIDALPLPAAGERATYHDQHTAGLQLRVTSSGKKTFSLYKRTKGGKPERITIGCFTDGVTVEQARTKALKLKSAMSEGISPAMAVRASRAELTFGEAFNMYIRDHATPMGLKSIERMRGDFERYLGTMPKTPKKKHGKERVKSPGSVNWQDRKLSLISQRDIKDLRASLVKECGIAAANHALKLVRVVFNKMCEWGEFKGENPALNPGLLKIASKDRFLQKHELPPLFEALAKTSNTNIRDFILLSIMTGARRSNVLSMRWCDIDLERAEWRIPDTKNGDPVIVQLSREAVETLQSRAPIPDGTEWVFPGSGKTGHMVSPKNGVSTILKAAKIEKLTIHDLRRTLGSWQAITGASLPIIGKSLGHKSVAATQIYARLSADPVRESVQRATGAIFDAATAKKKQINER